MVYIGVNIQMNYMLKSYNLTNAATFFGETKCNKKFRINRLKRSLLGVYEIPLA